ncbi:hypothetical protein KY284_032532 [Solanum tuberosum]|nr:hypothetical protein KY284_032532 [Solanum tuberosum]
MNGCCVNNVQETGFENHSASRRLDLISPLLELIFYNEVERGSSVKKPHRGRAVIISGTQRPEKEVATSSKRKRVRSGGNVPTAPVISRGKPGGSGCEPWLKKENYGGRSKPRLVISRMSASIGTTWHGSFQEACGISKSFTCISSLRSRIRHRSTVAYKAEHMPTLPVNSAHTLRSLVHVAMDQASQEEISPIPSLRSYAYGGALLGIGLEFHEPLDDVIPTDEERLCTSFDAEFDSDDKVDPAQAGDDEIADALSRFSMGSVAHINDDKKLKEAVLKKLDEGFFKGGDGVVRYQGRLSVPNIGDLTEQILAEGHGSWYSIHPGATRCRVIKERSISGRG